MEQLRLFDLQVAPESQTDKRSRKSRERLVQEYWDCIAGLRESHRRHAEILAKGTNDPFWPDGVNANLVRNHIIYLRKRLEEICSQTLLRLPEEYYWPVPEEVDDWYLAPGSGAMRCRIGESCPLTRKG